MSGAQVVPLYAYKDKAYYDNILPKINGVLFPGTNCGIKVVDARSTLKTDGPRMQIISSNT